MSQDLMMPRLDGGKVCKKKKIGVWQDHKRVVITVKIFLWDRCDGAFEVDWGTQLRTLSYSLKPIKVIINEEVGGVFNYLFAHCKIQTESALGEKKSRTFCLFF